MQLAFDTFMNKINAVVLHNKPRLFSPHYLLGHMCPFMCSPQMPLWTSFIKYSAFFSSTHLRRPGHLIVCITPLRWERTSWTSMKEVFRHCICSSRRIEYSFCEFLQAMMRRNIISLSFNFQTISRLSWTPMKIGSITALSEWLIMEDRVANKLAKTFRVHEICANLKLWIVCLDWICCNSKE